MNLNLFSTSLKATALIIPLGLIAWLSGNAFIFPSLGPTAFLMAQKWKNKLSLREVLGGHTCGVISGYLSYYFIVSPATLVDLNGMYSEAGLQIAFGAGMAIFLTALSMQLTKTNHPPACATTLIISLGVLPKVQDAGVIIVAVGVMYLLYIALFSWMKNRKSHHF